MAKQRTKTTDPLPIEVNDAHDVGIDPHRKTLTATVLDSRGGTVATACFKVSGVGHRALLEWATAFGAVRRWGIESASGLGRHTAMFLIDHDHDVRDVCPTRTAEQSRKRRQGKTDALDSLRIAREVQADPDLPVAFKRAPGNAGPDEIHELLNLWHNQRRSLLKSRQQLLNDALLHDLPEAIRADLPDDRSIRPRLKALAARDQTVAWDPVTTLRLRLLDDHTAAIRRARRPRTRSQPRTGRPHPPRRLHPQRTLRNLRPLRRRAARGDRRPPTVRRRRRLRPLQRHRPTTGVLRRR